MRQVDEAWLTRSPIVVGYELIGCVLTVCHDGVCTSGRIVECEAYAGVQDAASHAWNRAPARERLSWVPGSAYIYISYGLHTMMNIVAHHDGESGGVLIRGVEPMDGIEHMRLRRPVTDVRMLTRGPGVLSIAMGISMTDLGSRVNVDGRFFLHHGEPNGDVIAGPRVGITRAVDMPWRFFEKGNRYVSSHKRGQTISREELEATIPGDGVVVL